MSRRILSGVRIVFFAWALASGGVSAREPLTTEGRINRNAFPISRYGEKFTLLPKNVEAELRARIGQARAPIQLAPASWFRAAIGTAPPMSDRRKIMESVEDTEIWKCAGSSCSGCPGNETSGCVLGSRVAGGVGVVALIHPCLYGEGKCPNGAPTELSQWIEKYILGIAYYKAGLPKDGAAFRKSMKSSSEWLRNTSRSMNLMLGACPGPYSADSLRFLLGLEAVTLPNAALLRCGQSYLAELQNLGGKCALSTSPSKKAWEEFEKKMIRPSADILRCDDYCLKLLCRGKDAGTIFTAFSGKPVLLLGDGACEGETPKRMGRFIEDALPRELRGPVFEKSCAPAPEKSPPEKQGGVGSGESSSSVQLLDP